VEDGKVQGGLPEGLLRRRDVKAGISGYFHFYDAQRPHQALVYRTPAAVLRGESADVELLIS
jgi:hypothetical protein